ncbi:MAG: DNA-binding protein [Alphaproteobacteria bacterium]|nr:DNA-binding protein [Alphaproteobacteria bacterium]|tara:strand:+ start:227 stop:544 length:318 start_codon:yes stop_codon:yes gene_type:complete
MSESDTRFHIGQIVRHQLFGYRGAVFNVDPVFQGTEDWYESVARSRPPKDAPWYHVMVHDASHTTYVAERNLVADPEPGQIAHPLLGEFFTLFDGTRYIAGDHTH